MSVFQSQYRSPVKFTDQNSFTGRGVSYAPSLMAVNTANKDAEALNQFQSLAETHSTNPSSWKRSSVCEDVQPPLKRLKKAFGNANSLSPLNQLQSLAEIHSTNMTSQKRISVCEDVQRPLKRLKKAFGNANSLGPLNQLQPLAEIHATNPTSRKRISVCEDVRRPLKQLKKKFVNANSIDPGEDVIKQAEEFISVKSGSLDFSTTNDNHTSEEMQGTVICPALTDFLSPEPLKSHISSLRNLQNQDAMEETSETPTLHSKSENFCQLCYMDDELFFAPRAIYCSSCDARIKHEKDYYCTPEDSTAHYSFCSSCYRSLHGSITIKGCTICKAELVKKQNNDGDGESWVQCDRCEKWQHQICTLFNNKIDLTGQAEYICPLCYLKEIEVGKHATFSSDVPFTAKNLPASKLSDHIEHRLFRRLKDERCRRAEKDGLNIHEVPGAEDLVVRVVLSVKKQLKVKSQFLSLFRNKKYPSEFPYKSKAIFLFQKFDGVDVCLFGMYVQEFGSECCQPNERCVYISYLDSVKYFMPERKTVTGESLRTFVYHEVLLGYLDYCKRRGFATCFIWSCPPLKGDDYIFHCHPDMQKTPKSDKLRQWYKLLLKKAEKEQIVLNCTNLYDRFFVPSGDFITGISAICLPYFDGGYWSNAAEDILKSFQEDKRKELRKKVRNLLPKRHLKLRGHDADSKEAMKDILLMDNLGKAILPLKHEFIVANLQNICTNCNEVIFSGKRWFCSVCKSFQLCARCYENDTTKVLEKLSFHQCTNDICSLCEASSDNVLVNTEDNDIDFENIYLESRETVLDFCEKNNYQFDTLRRAKHSTMMILYLLHNSSSQALSTSKAVDVAHPCMRDLSVVIPPVQRKTLSDWLDLMVHASICFSRSSSRCSYPNCLMIKTLYRHARSCNIRVPRGCLRCSQAWWLLIVHSRVCRSSDCKVPRCMDLRKKREKNGTNSR